MKEKLFLVCIKRAPTQIDGNTEPTSNKYKPLYNTRVPLFQDISKIHK